MKNSILLAFLLLSLILTSSCSDKAVHKESPQVSVQFTVSNLTDEEYQSVGTKELENPTKDDFRKLHLIVKTQDFHTANKAIVKFPEFHTIFMADSQNRYWYGSGFDQPPTKESTTSEREIIFYTKGLKDNKAIKDYFTGIEVVISWFEEEKDVEMHYDLGEIIMFS